MLRIIFKKIQDEKDIKIDYDYLWDNNGNLFKEFYIKFIYLFSLNKFLEIPLSHSFDFLHNLNILGTLRY